MIRRSCIGLGVGVLVHMLLVLPSATATSSPPDMDVSGEASLPTEPFGTTSQLWSHTGPEGDAISSLAVDPTNPRRIYAAAELGSVIYWTGDAGENWHTSFFPSHASVRPGNLVVDPTDPQRVFAATHDGLFVSNDAGITWPTDPLIKKASTVEVRENGTVVASERPNSSTGASNLLVSQDHGETWEVAATPSSQGHVVALETSPTAVYATLLSEGWATSGGQGVWVSHDDGHNWTDMSAGLPSYDFGANPIVVAGDSLYISVNYQGLYKYNADQELWEEVPTTGLSPWNRNLGFSTVIADLSQNRLLASVRTHSATDRNDTYHYETYTIQIGGSTWTPLSPDLTEVPVKTLVVDPAAPLRLYAGGGGSEGVLRSIDSGETWTPVNRGLNAASLGQLVRNPDDPNETYAVMDCAHGESASNTSCGIYRSLDGGLSHQGVLGAGFPVNGMWAVAIDPSSPGTLYAAAVTSRAAAVYKSVDYGQHWTATGLPGIRWDPETGVGEGLGVASIVVDEQGTVFAADMYSGLVHWSNDGGQTWTDAETGLTGRIQQTRESLFTQQGSDVGPGTVFVGGNEGVSSSSDGGATWQLINDGLPPGSVQQLVGGPMVGDPVFAVVNSSQLYRRVGNSNWSFQSDGVSSVTVDSEDPNHLFGARDQQGVIAESMDGGATWTPLHDSSGAIPGGLSVSSLSFSGGRVLAATSGGLYWAGPPSPPREVAAGAGDGLVWVSWTAPQFLGGRDVEAYTVTIRDETLGTSSTVTSGTPSLLVEGLTNGHDYRLSVTANNGFGESDVSMISDVAIPQEGAPLPEGASQQLSPSGGTVDTGEATDTSLSDPTATSVEVNVEGAASVTEGEPSATAPDGETFVGQEVSIETPQTFWFEPLVQTFTIDASQVPPEWQDMDVYRSENDGPSQLVPTCAEPDVADPDPCVSSRELLESGDLQLTVLTTHNTKWRFAVPAASYGPSLVVETAGNGVGTVTSTIGGIDCGTHCAVMLPQGSSVTLHASAAPGSIFAGWTGACETTAGDCTLQMNELHELSAVFVAGSNVAAMADRFTPASLNVQQGTKVRWRSFSGDHDVTSTTAAPVLHSDLLEGATYNKLLTHAGVYPYRSTTDSVAMKGQITVPLKASASDVQKGTSVKITWASEAPPAPWTEQVRYRFKPRGSDTWSKWANALPLLTNTSETAGKLLATPRGTYAFRARLVKESPSGTLVGSNWSPSRSVSVN